ncbi:pyruvate/2-oxoglutarate dehydrogenase complex, dihydrolipoamide dehydrogenase component [Candidatus Magnetoovum chiemensis]|nr:pyruvate/2-oxoglutarate dehydrogenase complex, dihydrolipoamide dehydrogenase component [Candidatus Magnetoovum chiemensis]
MSNYNFDIGVIGGGAAGLTVTAGASQLGAKTVLIEKEERLGGDCLHYGCVPSKTLIKTAKVYHLINRAADFGLPSAKIEPVDFRQIRTRILSVIDIIQKNDSPERFCALGAKVEFGLPVFIDEHTVKVEGKTYNARNWVIATGSSSVIPKIDGLSSQTCITNKEVFYLDELPRSMIILGAGPIGVEMAQAFCRLGTKVTLLEKASQILPQEDIDMANILMDILRKEGVTVYLNCEVKRVDIKGQEKDVYINISGSSICLKSSVILAASGRKANIEDMGLDRINIEFQGNAIKVDKRLRTNHKHIYAAGDVNGVYPFTHAAGYEGGVVVSNAVFRMPRKVNYKYMPRCTYTDPEFACIGMNEKTLKAANINYTSWSEDFHSNDRSLAEGYEAGKIKMLLDEKGKTPLGVQILYHHGGEILSQWVSILNGGVSLSSVASSVAAYPTLSEINKKVAAKYYSTKIFSNKVNKALKFLFNLKGRACE